MRAQLKRSGIDRNIVLSLALHRELLLSNFKITTENNSSHKTVLVKKSNGVYDFKNLLRFGV